MTTFYEALEHYRASDCALERRYLREVWAHIDRAEGQLFQDCFVLAVLGHDRPGTFCEFGAADGKWLSNTYMLEREYGWSGIVAEPARCWHAGLQNNRPRAAIDQRCVWQRSGESLTFVETPEAEFSTLAGHVASDHHAVRRSEGVERYAVETVSLHDLLDGHGFTHGPDFLSIDTEGAELDILRGFDCAKRGVKVVCVEHNMTAQESQLDALLTAQGYRRCLEPWSRWDAWYVEASILTG